MNTAPSPHHQVMHASPSPHHQGMHNQSTLQQIHNQPYSYQVITSPSPLHLTQLPPSYEAEIQLKNECIAILEHEWLMFPVLGKSEMLRQLRPLNQKCIPQIFFTITLTKSVFSQFPPYRSKISTVSILTLFEFCPYPLSFFANTLFNSQFAGKYK